MSERGQLSANGAQLLRAARDQILAHPDQFCLGEWECGTTACIAGWMARLHPALTFTGQPNSPPDTSRISAYCGFGEQRVLASGHPLDPLFYPGYGRWKSTKDPNEAAERINAFLWGYGFPAQAIEAPRDMDGADVKAEPVTVTVRREP